MFVEIPKTGSTSLHGWLRHHHGGRAWRSQHSRDIPGHAQGWRVYLVVRDPIERIGSFWVWENFRRGLRRSFERWMRVRVMGPKTEAMLAPQAKWVDELDATVLNLETLDEDLARWGFDGPPVPRKNVTEATPWGAGKFVDSCTPANLSLIMEYSPDDFDRFGYTRPEVLT